MTTVLRLTRRAPLLPLLGLAIVLLAAAAAFGLVQGERSASRWVAHTLRTQLAIVRFQEELTRFESGYRGYLLRGSDNLLADVIDAKGNAWRDLALLEAETADNPAQRARVAVLYRLMEERVAFGERWIGYKREGTMARRLATTRGEPGRDITNLIRAEAAAMMAMERALLVDRQRTAQTLSLAISVGLALAVLAVMTVALLMVRDAERRTIETEAARDAAIAEGKAREAVEEKLRQMQKMEAVGQLTGGIAHDFNNMLAIVIGSLDLAGRRMGDPARLEQALAGAREGAMRAASLTARLLAFSRQSPLAPVAIDANRLVEGMSDLLRRTLGERITIDTRLADDLWTSRADPGELENALLNLCVNARDAMAERRPARLTITTANTVLSGAADDEMQPGDYVTIAVRDTGTGMPPEVSARAFDPFFTTKTVGKGTGLGLSQVFGFARQSGGRAVIESTPGIGTVVRLYLPRHRGPADGVDASPHAAGAMPAGRPNEMILVCEDEQRVRHYSVDALSELGYTAISSQDQDDALAILARTSGIVLLFTDVVMPGISGRELADRALAMRPDLKVLFTTGYTRNAVVHDGLLDPGVALLPKPFTMSQLARKIRDTLDDRGANRPA